MLNKNKWLDAIINEEAKTRKEDWYKELLEAAKLLAK